MSRTVLRRTSAAAVLTLALSGLAACGGGGASTSAADPAPASSSTTDASESPSEEATPEGLTAGQDVDPADMIDVFESAFENATTATLTMKIGDQLDAEGVADFSASPPEMQMQMTLPQAPEPIEFILVDGFSYYKVPGGGGKYTKTALDDPASPFGQLGSQLDLRSQFDTMEKAITAATYVGEEDGLQHYSLALDSATLLAGVAGSSTAPTPDLPATFAYDMFFDGDGHLRRMESDLSAAGGGAGTVIATYDNWGEPVDIAAPDDSEITEAPGF